MKVHCAANNLVLYKVWSNGYQCSSKKNKPVKVASIYEVYAITTLVAQVKAITKRMDAMMSPPQAPVMIVESFGSQASPNYSLDDSSAWQVEHVDYVGQNS